MKFGIVVAMLAVSSIVFILACSDSDNPVAPPAATVPDSAAIISMTFDTATVGSAKQANISVKVSGPVSQGNYYTGYKPATDFAVWIENSAGKYINTVKVSKGSAKIGDYAAHEAHLPIWQKSSGLDLNKVTVQLDTAGIPVVLDGLTGASLKCRTTAGYDTTMTLVWSMRDSGKVAVPSGSYFLCVETANIIKNKTGSTGADSVVMTINNNYRKKSIVF
ncbi:MAG: hypothetical protein JNL74_06310 [Fibrobacteres bacterium]|nr:hypothetical protein [Fibrobacterota bacterium]